ncbi:MAG TPA: DUF5719 family protein [Pseudolysinimonas sp.]|nr:DUF5719 family protein [Pseudolysinimonas sp.]
MAEPTPEPPEDLEPAELPAPGDEQPARPGRGRRAALLSLRLVAGAVATVAAAATVGAVGLLPLPTSGITPPSVEVTPVAADEVRTCAGGALRLGDETGANADTAVAIGIPAVRADAVNASLQHGSISESDAGNGGSAAAPQVLRIASAEGALLTGAQSQVVDASNFSGFSAAACAEPSGSIWLTGGATTVGRTSILTISNPTPVRALVSLTIYGEQGVIEAPGLTGIDVAAGAQRVLSLAGFAPGLLSPVVHVEARGGQVVAYLQQSIVRGLDATGVDLVDAAPDPATELVFPGVQIHDSLGTSRAMSLEDWDDVAPVVRILNPGTEPAEVTVSVTPVDAEIAGTGFTAQAEPGVVTELALDSGADVDSGVALADGVYTVTVSSAAPVVAGVRTSAAADIGPVETEGIVPAPPSDVAWYTAAPALGDLALFTVPPGPAPVLATVNPTDAELAVILKRLGNEEVTLTIPAGGAVTTALVAGETYELQGATGLRAAVSYAADEAMAAFPVTVARPVSGPIVIRP